MPSLGADMERGTLVEWLVKPGDYVRRGDLVAVVDTEKTVMDVETFEEGVVSELLVGVGTSVPVGTPLARIVPTPAAGGVPVPAHPPRAAPLPPVPPPAPTVGPPQPVPVPQHAPPGSVTPPVRTLAHRLGVDLAAVRGTGRGGAVTRADVERAVSGSIPVPPAPAPIPPGPVPPSPAPPAPTPPAPPAPGPGPTPPVQPPPSQSSAAAGAPAAGRVPSSPRARRLAVGLGLGLSAVRGTGPHGAVTEADVRAAAAYRTAPDRTDGAGGTRPAGVDPETAARETPAPLAPGPVPAAEPGGGPGRTTGRATGLRRAVGALMSRSKQTIPHYYLGSTLDLQAALEWMREQNARRPVSSRLVPSALLLKAAARAAGQVPEVNGFYTDGTFRPSAAVHLGVAVALRRGGLVAPALHDADTLPLDVLMERLRDLVARARTGHLQRAEMADPTITVTNLGDLGVESVYGVIYPPQVAMVGFGRVLEQPWASNGMLGVHHTVHATLSADHRVSDGLRGGRFLALMEDLLQKPEEL